MWLVRRFVRELIVNPNCALQICQIRIRLFKKNVSFPAQRFAFFHAARVPFQNLVIKGLGILPLTQPAFNRGLFVTRGPPEITVDGHDLRQQFQSVIE